MSDLLSGQPLARGLREAGASECGRVSARTNQPPRPHPHTASPTRDLGSRYLTSLGAKQALRPPGNPTPTPPPTSPMERTPPQRRAVTSSKSHSSQRAQGATLTEISWPRAELFRPGDSRLSQAAHWRAEVTTPSPSSKMRQNQTPHTMQTPKTSWKLIRRLKTVHKGSRLQDAGPLQQQPRLSVPTGSRQDRQTATPLLPAYSGGSSAATWSTPPAHCTRRPRERAGRGPRPWLSEGLRRTPGELSGPLQSPF